MYYDWANGDADTALALTDEAAVHGKALAASQTGLEAQIGDSELGTFISLSDTRSAVEQA